MLGGSARARRCAAWAAATARRASSRRVLAIGQCGLVSITADGNFFIVDRKKDMIIRGGYYVYPREIEEVLYEHPTGKIQKRDIVIPADLAAP